MTEFRIDSFTRGTDKQYVATHYATGIVGRGRTEEAALFQALNEIAEVRPELVGIEAESSRDVLVTRIVIEGIAVAGTVENVRRAVDLEFEAAKANMLDAIMRRRQASAARSA